MQQLGPETEVSRQLSESFCIARDWVPGGPLTECRERLLPLPQERVKSGQAIEVKRRFAGVSYGVTDDVRLRAGWPRLEGAYEHLGDEGGLEGPGVASDGAICEAWKPG